MPCLDDVLPFLFFFFFSAEHAHVRRNKKKALLEGGDELWLAGLSNVADSFYDSDIGEN